MKETPTFAMHFMLLVVMKYLNYNFGFSENMCRKERADSNERKIFCQCRNIFAIKKFSEIS
jgi:hypothetical protein